MIAEGVTVARTDASGRVTINPGAAELTIVAENSDLQPAELEVARGRGGQSYRVVLPAVPVPVDVTATDADGAPINASFSAFGPDNHRVMLDGPGSLALVPGAWTITSRTADGRVGAARITVDAQGHPAVVVAVAAVASRQEGAQLRPAAPMWFDLDSAALRPDAEAIVHDLARWLNADRTVALVEVAGHTDDQGGVTYNQQLSEQRARAVRDALLARGVAPERLVARGYGLSRPVSADTTDAARQANRRVELVVVRTSGE